MRKFLILILLPLALCCDNPDYTDMAPGASAPCYFAEINSAQNKTYIDGASKVKWSNGDKISVFTGQTNQEYYLSGETQDGRGVFSAATSNSNNGALFQSGVVYAVYPYNPETKASEAGEITISLPDTQSYAENSFYTGINPMVAVKADKESSLLSFMNLCGVLKVSLFGGGIKVKTIRLIGNSGERLSGGASVTARAGEAPVLIMNSDSSGEIILDCGESGICLGETEENATAFWFVIPPTEFKNGITIMIEDTDGHHYTKATGNEITISRSTVSSMRAIKPEDPFDCRLFEKDEDGVDGLYMYNGNYLFINDNAVDGRMVCAFGTAGTEAKGCAVFDAKGFLEVLSFEDYIISFVYTPEELWAIDENGDVIAEIPYSYFETIPSTMTRAAAFTRTKIYQCTKILVGLGNIGVFIKATKKEKIVTALTELFGFASGNLAGRYGDILGNIVGLCVDWKDVFAWVETIDSIIEARYFGNASLTTNPAVVTDIESVRLSCDIRDLMEDNKLISRIGFKFANKTEISYKLTMNIYEGMNVVEDIIVTQTKSISSDGQYEFNFTSFSEPGHLYFFDPNLTVYVTAYFANEILACVMPGENIPEDSYTKERKSYSIYGESLLFQMPGIWCSVLGTTNIGATKADIKCTFSDIPSNAECGVEITGSGDFSKQIRGASAKGEQIISVTELHPGRSYKAKAYIKYKNKTTYSDNEQEFNTKQESVPSLYGKWLFKQFYFTNFSDSSQPSDLLLDFQRNDSWGIDCMAYTNTSAYVSLSASGDRSGVVRIFYYSGSGGADFFGTFDESYSYMSGDSYVYHTSYSTTRIEKPWSIARQ